MTSVTYNNGSNNEPLSEWMKRKLFIDEEQINTDVKIIRKPDHVLVSPVSRVKDLNDVKHKGMY